MSTCSAWDRLSWSWWGLEERSSEPLWRAWFHKVPWRPWGGRGWCDWGRGRCSNGDCLQFCMQIYHIPSNISRCVWSHPFLTTLASIWTVGRSYFFAVLPENSLSLPFQPRLGHSMASSSTWTWYWRCRPSLVPSSFIICQGSNFLSWIYPRVPHTI